MPDHYRFLLISLLFTCSSLSAIFPLQVSAISLEEKNFFEEDKIPGLNRISKVDTVFAIRGVTSDSQEIIVETDNPVTLALESHGETLMFSFASSQGFASTSVTIRGLEAGRTYYHYLDDFHSDTAVVADDAGTYSFVQDLENQHFIFFQTRKSTRFIKDNAVGGDCNSIGLWDVGTKTCTLTHDVYETIQIDNDGVTLDGNGKHLIGSGAGPGVFIFGRKNVEVKNLNIENFSTGILVRTSQFITLKNNDVFRSSVGLWIESSSDSLLEDNTVREGGFGIYFIFASSRMTLIGNQMSGNQYDTYIRGTLNFGGLGHHIDTTNTVGGKSIYYFENLEDTTIENIPDMGLFHCVTCHNVTLRNVTIDHPNETSFLVMDTTDSRFEDITLTSGSVGARLYNSHNNIFSHNDFRDNLTGVLFQTGSSNNVFHQNNFYANSFFPMYQVNAGVNILNRELPLGGNYWDTFDTPEEGCEDLDDNLVCDAPYSLRFGVGTDYYPWDHKDAWELPECCSNVAFIPGIQASRLYLREEGSENQLWEPNRNADGEKLFMNDDGTSGNDGIYTHDVIDEAFGFNVYKDFSAFMDDLVATGTISAWKAFPYDWRFDVRDVAKGDVALPDGDTYRMIGVLKGLAELSKNGKVTIITHSNGGLVAKALLARLIELKALGESDLIDHIDQLILVAAPQIGTPKTLAGLLHGDGQNLPGGILGGFLLHQSTARELGENMPGAYGLIPSEKYFETVLDPVVKFGELAEEAGGFVSAYGDTIDTHAEFQSFLRGSGDGRTEPETTDLATPNVLSSALLASSTSLHESLNNFVIPPHIKVTQIAGWGLDTISGIEYYGKETCEFNEDLSACLPTVELKRKPIFTVEGDRTVVYPSAISTLDSDSLFLHIEKYNNQFQTSHTHLDLLEIDILQNLIANLLNEIKELPDFFSSSKPEPDSGKKSIRVSVHSPVSLHIYDSIDNHTGIIPNPDPDSDLILYEENIPNSYYLDFDGEKYAGFEGESTSTIKLLGEGFGLFTLNIEEVTGNNVASSTQFTDILVTPTLQARMSITDLHSPPTLSIDVNDDGSNDFIVSPQEEFDPTLFLQMMKKTVESLGIDKKTKKNIIKKVDQILKKLEKGKDKQAAHKIKKFIEKLKTKKFKKDMSDADSQALIAMFEELLDNLR